MATPYACKGNDSEFDIALWEKWSDESDISENETNKWITPTTRIRKKLHMQLIRKKSRVYPPTHMKY